MKEFLDSSVLVAAFLGDHPEHEASAEVFAHADRRRTSCSAHSLAEIYATLTRLPLKPMIAPEQAMLFLRDVRHRVSAIALDEERCVEVLESTAAAGIVGGRVYDALILGCAVEAKAEVIYTWNLKHFKQLRPDIADRIRTP